MPTMSCKYALERKSNENNQFHRNEEAKLENNNNNNLFSFWSNGK